MLRFMVILMFMVMLMSLLSELVYLLEPEDVRDDVVLRVVGLELLGPLCGVGGDEVIAQGKVRFRVDPSSDVAHLPELQPVVELL